METVLFWIVWGLISFWALKTFYYSFSGKKLEGLRKTALGIHLAVFILAFLPWLPPSLGGKTGLTLALEGNVYAMLFVFLLVGSVVIFLMKDIFLLKIASSATIVNTIVLFVIMNTLRPGSFVLTLYDIAPIIAVLLFLVCDVVVLLLWQQLQLKERKVKSR